jgi:hypothetical protein
MKTLQQKKDCIIKVLSRYQNEFTEQIDRLNTITKEEDYEIYFTELCVLLATTNKELLSEIHLCQNPNSPTEIQNTNIN